MNRAIVLLLVLSLAACGGPVAPTPTPIPASVVRVPQHTPVFPDQANVFSGVTPAAAVFVDNTSAGAPTLAPAILPAQRRALLRAAVSAQTPSALGIASGGGAIYDAPGGSVLTSIPSGGLVTVTGISADGRWYAVYDDGAVYGWTPAGQLRIFGGDDLIVVESAPDPGPVATLLAEAAIPVNVLDALMEEMATRTAPTAPAVAVVVAAPTESAPRLATPTPAPVQEIGGSASVVGATRVNVRAAPSTSERIIARLEPGATVTVTARDESGEWLQVETGTFTGWVAAEYLSAISD